MAGQKMAEALEEAAQNAPAAPAPATAAPTPAPAAAPEKSLAEQLREEEERATEEAERRARERMQDDDEPEVEVLRDTWATVRRLWAECKDQHWRFIFVVVMITFYTVFNLAAPAYSAVVVDTIWNEAQAAFAKGQIFTVSWDHAGREILTFFGIWTVATIFYTVQGFVMASFAERLNLTLRNRVAQKLSRLPLAFFDSHKPGEVVSRATNDLDKMSEVLQRGILTMLSAIGSVVGALILMFIMSWQLACIFLVFSGISLLLTKVVSGKTLQLAAARQAKVGTLTAAVEEAYSGRVVIRAFNREAASAAQMRALTDDLAHASYLADFATNAIMSAIRFISRLCQVCIGLLGCSMMIQGRMTIGVFQSFFQLMVSANEPLTEMSFTINSLQGALASVERVFDLLDEPEVSPEPLPAAASHVAQPVQGRVCFSHVRFGYAPDKPLMHDVSFTAEPGQKIAIVGTTGAGKTTLINLLMRFYEIDGGRITLDGVDTAKMDRGELRRNFGMVLQDSWLFEGTIEQNIAFGNDGATHDEVVAAARAAQVDYFVRTMPKGYSTMVANDAEGISQGQRQLLTIARVLLNNPSILILDEATSSVDTRTELAIGRAMDALMRNRTSFVIAHRLSTIVDADLILVMRAGNIIEQGTHEQLLAAGGVYADLFNSQFA